MHNKILSLMMLSVIAISGCVGGSTYYYSNVYEQIPMQPEEEFQGYDVQISFSDSTVCVGESVTGYVDTNIPNGICRLWFDAGAGWKYDSDVALDANGDYVESRTPSMPGYVTYFGVCCDLEGNCKMSNTISLTIEACPYENWKCCMISRTQFSCIQNMCPNGITPIKSFGSLASCQADCKAPVIPPPTCSDSDGGDDVWVKGTCTDSSGSTTDVCPTGDFSEYISEAYCIGSTCGGLSSSCYDRSATCYGGRCIRWDQDSDGDGWFDLDEYEQGTDPNNVDDFPQFQECNEWCMMMGYPFGGFSVTDPMQCYQVNGILIPSPTGLCCCHMPMPM